MRKIELMHSIFGRTQGRKCSECSNFCEYLANSVRVKKCSIYGLTSSEASDWRNKYDACGMFNMEYKGAKIIGLKKHYTKEKIAEPEMDGQIGLEDT